MLLLWKNHQLQLWWLSYYTSSSTTADDLVDAVSIYGLMNVVIVVMLSTMVVFRKTLSCNRTYHITEDDEEDDVGDDDDDDDTLASSSSSRSNKHTVATTATKFLITTMSDEDEKLTDELLDGAGHFCSLTPILSLAASQSKSLSSLPLSSSPSSLNHSIFPLANQELTTTSSKGEDDTKHSTTTTATSKLLTMPLGIQVLICDFCHPKDVVSLSSCCKTTYNTIMMDEQQNSSSSSAIWYTLWKRDYSWILSHWQPGKDAFQRSKRESLSLSNNIITNRNDDHNDNVHFHVTNNNDSCCIDSRTTTTTTFKFTKEFYFRFGLCWSGYVLAGNNTKDQCLVSIHGCIYNIGPFLDTHPGSPETLMVHSGQDATRFFEDMSHSMGARRLAHAMCIVVNKSIIRPNDLIVNNSSSNNNNSNNVIIPWGLAPTSKTELIQEDDLQQTGCYNNNNKNSNDPSIIPPTVDNINNLLGSRRRSKPLPVRTLTQIHNKFHTEQTNVQLRVQKHYTDHPPSTGGGILGEPVIYYDPFLTQWRVWYTTKDLRTVFCPAPGER